MGGFLGWCIVSGALFSVREKAVVIRSAGAAIRCRLGVLGGQARVHDFADTLEAAKYERLRLRAAAIPISQASTEV
jgi:hypothetical protein